MDMETKILSTDDFTVDTSSKYTLDVFLNIDLINNEVTQIVPSVIQHIRQKLGWTQAKLAKKMGTKQSSIARAENLEKAGKWDRISLRFYQRFAIATKCGYWAPRFRDKKTGKIL